MEIEEWEEFKENNKGKAKEIQSLCVKISAQWPLAVLSEEEKKAVVSKTRFPAVSAAGTL